MMISGMTYVSHGVIPERKAKTTITEMPMRLLLLVLLTFSSLSQSMDVVFSRNCREPITSMAIREKRLYAGLYNGAILTFDIANPAAPLLLDSTNVTGAVYTYGSLTISESGFLYANHHVSTGLRIFSLANPDKPKISAVVDSVMAGSTRYLLSSNISMVMGSTLYMDGGLSGVLALDIANPLEPVYLYKMQQLGIMHGITQVKGKIAIIDGYTLNLFSGTAKKTVDIPGAPETIVRSVDENTLFIGGDNDLLTRQRLFSVDVATESMLDSLELYPALVPDQGELRGIGFRNLSDTLFVGTGKGIASVSVLDRTNIRFLEYKKLPNGYAPNTLYVSDNYLIVNENASLVVLSINVPIGVHISKFAQQTGRSFSPKPYLTRFTRREAAGEYTVKGSRLR